MKRFFQFGLSVIGSMSLILTLALDAFAFPAFVNDVPDAIEYGNGPPVFADDAPWYTKAVYYLYYAHIVDASRIVNDENDGQLVLYEPDKELTREQFICFLGHLAENCDLGMDKGPDGQVLTPHDYVQWAAEHGILYGKGNGYAEHDTLTRQEMIIFLQRFAKYTNMKLDVSNMENCAEMFADGDSISPWARDGIAEAYSAGVVSGEHHQGLCYIYPQRAATRAEAAQIIYNFVRLSGVELPFYADEFD